ncbi:MAG: hypothetical protein ISR25_07725 [Candidatus Poseidoniaceae archaeon]|nr:hypothetical protein [Candidatus Poseidoniaceae archaeon]
MSDEENVTEAEAETTEFVPVLDEDRDEIMKDMTLEERQEALKRSRWNVFLYLGLAALMFGFALFPFPFTAEPVGNSYEQDLGFVWGAPLDGEDFTDVPIEIEVTATKPPTNSDARIAVYLINSDDCTGSEMLDLKLAARTDASHDNQFQISNKAPIEDQVLTFDFNVDGGGQCLFVEYVDKDDLGEPLFGSMEIDGSMWPNQIWAGIFAILFLGLSGFAFLGAQKHGAGVKALTEPSKKSTEEEVLEQTAGPTGPPPSTGPSGPPQAGPSGPPEASGPAGPPEPHAPEAVTGGPTFEAADNGYFFRKMPDGSYDQTVYVQAEDGSYVPYEE